jgi:hypothetical protein
MITGLTVMPAPESARRAARGQAPAGIHDFRLGATKVVDTGIRRHDVLAHAT